MRGTAILLVLSALISTCLAVLTYEGYQVYRTPRLNHKMLGLIHTQVLSHPEFQAWTQPKFNEPAEILVCSKNRQNFLRLMRRLKIKPHLYIYDVARVLEKERQEIEVVRSGEEYGLDRNVTFERYMDLEEISDYIADVVLNFPTIASNETIGFSYEGRPQTVLKLSNGGSSNKIGIFIDAAIHAAEWLAPAVALNTIHQLTAELATNQAYLDMADWYILPVANPDGYYFSWTEDRLWRKTRRPNSGSDCFGADPNRNFDNHWGEGGLFDPCVWNYPGPSLYSEIESKNIADYLVEKASQGSLDLYLALHTFGQYLLHPYGFSFDLPPNNDDLSSAANAAVEALEEVRGTKYTVGNSASVLYLAFGNSQDFAYEQANIPFSYTMELPRGGPTGHDPPPSEIQPVVDETWEATKVLVQRVFDSRIFYYY